MIRAELAGRVTARAAQRRTAVTTGMGLLAALATGLLGAAPAAAGTAAAAQPTWHADQARVPEARSAGRDGEGVVVAVLDSWVDGTHKDFEGRVLTGADCLGGTCRPGPAASDPCHHGTHVAGTVASSSYGVAPRATVLPVRVLSYDAGAQTCVGRPDDVAAGVRWAVANGARVLNLSLGPDDAPLLTGGSGLPAAVRDAARAGVVVVFSAGNADLPQPSRYGDDALVVAATGPDGELASYSQPGDVAAPGGDPVAADACTRADCITSLFPDDGYSVAAGTSMAAPHVTGIAALLLGQDAGRSREDVVARLTGTAHGSARLVDARAALGAPTAGTTSQSSAPPSPVDAAAPAPPAPLPQSGEAPSQPPPPPAPVSGLPVPAPLPPVATTSGTAVAPPPSRPAPVVAAPAPTPSRSPVPVALVGLATGLFVAAAASTLAANRLR